MKFSWEVMLFTMAIVLWEGFVAYRNGTFSSKQWRNVNLSFLKHTGASVGDLIILPIVNGFFFPNLIWSWWYIPGIIVSLIITWQCHKAWWPDPNNKLAQGFILISNHGCSPNRNLWHKAMTPEGWIHFFFMAAELPILGGYILTPMPIEVVKINTLLLGIFVPFGVIIPGIVQTGGWKQVTTKDWIITGAMANFLYGLLILVYFLKIS